ncbi:type I polyketide synthase [Rhizobium sp. NLR22b]|uniref:type I polyketide synthase n=1 Tax=Rhizobium sp. NLR22b TaxID=2731115 RepID=UPI001C82BD16|nr:type I polyketide synthase [Rhizobium sp. NLR22b]MBX5242847.1 SDR family NAD(P)-dependent oxidoreductase [Rhizobium sp. NLR22b]
MTLPYSNSSNALAIVAAGCRYPGGITDTASLWEALVNKMDAVCQAPPDRWDLRKYYDPRPKTPGKMYVREGAFLKEDIWKFDPNYFGMGPLEAERLDPQQRLLLKVTLEALENANITKRDLQEARTGVYVGCFSTDNVVDASSTQSKLRLIAAQSHTCGVVTMLSARLSYHFGLTGPCLSVDTACSSSLVAFHLACQAIRSGEVDQALVGGVNVMFRPEFTTTMCFGGFLAKDGRCKTFSAKGDGYGRGEGAGVVLVKPYEKAIEHGNEILAIVCGTGVNQDGRTNGITVPNEHSQLELMRTVAKQSGIAPSQIGYAEAHGTGTAVGDPKEAYSLGSFLSEGRDADARCYVGSVKTNIGHQEAGAGIAGIIKTALCLKHGKVVPNLHFEDPNPAIDFDGLQLAVPTRVADLEADYACVNSFGFGGTNAHAILRKPLLPEGQRTRSRRAEKLSQRPILLPLSARSEASLRARAKQYAEALDHASIDDLAYTVGCHRDHENLRAAVVAMSAEKAMAKLRAFSEQEETISDVFQGKPIADGTSAVVFLFTGMGAQSWGMGASLMKREPVFAQAIARLDEIFTRFSSWSLTRLFTDPESFGNASLTAMDEPRFAQPSNLAIQLALADVWRSRGLTPGCIIGHSVGEIAAACIAGSLSEEDALAISYHRGELHQRLSGRGGMLAAGTTAKEVAPLLVGKRISIAAVNSPSALTLSGDERELDELAAQLSADGIFARRLQVKVPYHSVLMEETREDFFALLDSVTPKAAKVPLYSTLKGMRITGEELNCDYWWQNSREAVQFYSALDLVLAAGYRNFLEVGPHPVLRGSVLETAKARNAHSVICVESLNRKYDDLLTIERSRAMLYANGAEIDWGTAAAGGQKIALPTYPWDEQRYAYFQDSPENERLVHEEHPFLQNKQQVPGDSWRAEVNPQFFPWLDHHQIQGHPILPGAAYVEAMFACASRYGKATDRWALRDVRISSIQPTDDNVDFSVDVDRDEISIHSRGMGQDAWERRASGRIVRTPPERHFPGIDPRKDMQNCRVFDQKAIYTKALENEYGFGPKFQVIKQFFVRDNVIYSQIDASHLSDEIDAYYIHPIVLDGIFQILNGVYVADMPAAKHGQYLPAGLNEIRLFQRGIKECWVRCEFPSEAGHSVHLDMSVHDLDGAVIGEIRGYRSVVVSAGDTASEKDIREKLYTITWEPTPWPEVSTEEAAGPHDGRWLIFADQQGRTSQWIDASRQYMVEHELWQSPPKLRARLEEILATETIVGAIYGWALDKDPAQTGDADIDIGIQNTALVLELLQALAANHPQNFQKIVVLTDGAALNEGGLCTRPGQAPLIGLCRTAKIELSELGITLLELNGTIPERRHREFLLSRALQDHEVACGASGYWISRLKPLDQSPVRLVPAEHIENFSLSVSDRGGTDSLRFVERERKRLSPDEVEIEVRASGLNFKDLMKVLGLLDSEYIAGTYFGNTLGMECSGVISRVGEAVTHLKVGDPVVAGAADSFAKYVVLPGAYVFRKPSTLSFAEAVVPFINTMPAYFGLIEKANLKPGDKVLIHSASGGVGLTAIQIAQMVGAEVYATAGNEKKRKYLRDLGVKYVSDSRSLKFFDDIMDWTHGKGVDVVLNFLPGEAMEKSVELLTFGGRFVELGKIDILADNRLHLGLFQKNISITHVDFDYITTHCPEICIRLMRQILDLYKQKKLLPIKTTTFPARSVKDAFDFMKTSEHIGKIVLDMSDRDDLMVVPTGRPLPIMPDGLYLITGGFSALGLRGAQWLVNQGARHLGLVGRSGAKSDEDRQVLSHLRDQGIEILELRADVSDAEGVKSLQAAIAMPVRGILHLATVYHDVPIVDLKEDDLRRVMGVKAKGLHHVLHSLGHETLDWIVNFSSLASYGNHAQASYAAANTYLDALAQSMDSRGRTQPRILSVNWGPIHAGELGRNAALVRYFEESGVIPMPADDIFPTLEGIARTPFNQVGACEIVWERFIKNSAQSRSQLFAVQAAALQQGGGSRIIDQLHALDADQQRNIAEDFISRYLSDVLHVQRENITPDTRMDELGVDSLMAVTLSLAIEGESSVDLGTVAFLQKPTVRKLAAEWLSKKLKQQTTQEKSHQVEQWVQLSAPQMAKARLLCFPGAGMSARGYKDLADALPEIEVFGMCYPASMDRPNEEVNSIEAIGKEMARVIASLPPSTAPLVILGHSLGALFAYEAAYTLQQSGTPASHLILAAPGLPHARDIFNEAEGRRAWTIMKDAAGFQTGYLAVIQRLSEKYVVRPQERARVDPDPRQPRRIFQQRQTGALGRFRNPDYEPLCQRRTFAVVASRNRRSGAGGGCSERAHTDIGKDSNGWYRTHSRAPTQQVEGSRIRVMWASRRTTSSNILVNTFGMTASFERH